MQRQQQLARQLAIVVRHETSLSAGLLLFYILVSLNYCITDGSYVQLVTLRMLFNMKSFLFIASCLCLMY